MSEYAIDKSVPIPKKRSKYPFSEMEIGDSFSVSINGDSKDEAARKRSSINTAAYLYGKATQIKFKVRTSEVEIRCWRIK